jgi:hypothetical protein
LVKWIDEGDALTGSAYWVHNGASGDSFYSNIVSVGDEQRLAQEMELWRQTGGYDLLNATDKPLTKQQIDDIARKIHGGHTSADITEAAIHYLTTRLDSTVIDPDQITAPDFNLGQPAISTPPTLEIS